LQEFVVRVVRNVHFCGRGVLFSALNRLQRPRHRMLGVGATPVRHSCAREVRRGAAEMPSCRTAPLPGRRVCAARDTRPIQPGSNLPSRTAGQPGYNRADSSVPFIPLRTTQERGQHSPVEGDSRSPLHTCAHSSLPVACFAPAKCANLRSAAAKSSGWDNRRTDRQGR